MDQACEGERADGRQVGNRVLGRQVPRDVADLPKLSKEDWRRPGRQLPQLHPMALPEAVQGCVGAFEDIPLERAVELAEVEREAVPPVAVHFRP